LLLWLQANKEFDAKEIKEKEKTEGCYQGQNKDQLSQNRLKAPPVTFTAEEHKISVCWG